MTNIIQLSKSQGFTRMDNEIYEALIGADLSGRELRVALAITVSLPATTWPPRALLQRPSLSWPTCAGRTYLAWLAN